MPATVVTRKGRDIIANRLVGTTPTQAEPKILCWGLNPNTLTANATDIALYQEAPEIRVTGTATVPAPGTTTPMDTYQVTGTIAATAGRSITEAALADSTTQPTVGAVAAGGVVGSTVATTLNTAATFSPGNNNYIQIRNEVMQVTAGSGTTSLTVVRAQNGSAAIGTITVADVVTPGNIPGTTAIAGGSLLTHADFGVITLVSGDSIAFTWKVQFT